MKHKRIFAALTSLCLAVSMTAAGIVHAEGLPAERYDINGDNSVDIMDVISLSKYIHAIEMPKNIARADMDGDGEVDVFDLGLYLYRLIHGEQPTPQKEEIMKLSAAYAPHSVKTAAPGKDILIGQTKFALDLVKLTAEAGKNVLVSPYSVSQALGMTANGARGATREEMESVLGGKMEALNPAFSFLRTSAPDREDAKLTTANSIWVRSGYPVLKEFLQTNADYYGADAFAAPMDHSTVEEINGWVDENTDHMIPSIIKDEDITKDTEIILANAVAFDAKWERPYETYSVNTGKFTAADGTKQDVEMMHRDLYDYLEDEHATGFMQCYKGGEYAFAAILPEEGMTPEAYLADLTPERLNTMLSNPVQTKVVTMLPEFEYDYSATLNRPLETMGMTQAFKRGTADFFGMTDDERGLYIGKVIHKTHIEVTPIGTRAGAATAVEMAAGAALMPEPKVVTLDRPFVYAIVDTKTSLPIFIGTVNSIADNAP